MRNNEAMKTQTYLERVERVQSTLTPRPEKFADSIYPKEEVRRDLSMLAVYKHSAEFIRGEERSDAKLLEKTFIDMAESDDWFSEDDRFGDDPDYEAISTIPTSEIDDVFNHIDMIGTISNEDTGHERMHFAIDLTYNTDPDKLQKKFSWKHMYGMKRTAPEGASEFGEIVTERAYDGSTYKRTRRLRDKFRYGLKIPGFASAKYFEDTDRDYDPDHEKGRIRIMPRFVVGYSPEIADTLAQGKPTEEMAEKYGRQYYNERMFSYNVARTCAKWCALNECAEQAAALCHMLDKLTPEQTKWMHPDELSLAKKQAEAMNKYFGGALARAQENAKGDTDEQAAMRYAESDEVRNGIQLRTGLNYIDGVQY
ncbi:hypothetical protein J6X13_01910 [Candidatus Saccharibacteria bacterium]|nr:hypothetical protein [Candidatus Saccharibacteria bacterium]